MRKKISFILVLTLLLSGLFLTGCSKDSEGKAKYEFTTEKPKEIKEFDEDTLAIINSLKIEAK